MDTGDGWHAVQIIHAQHDRTFHQPVYHQPMLGRIDIGSVVAVINDEV